MAPFDNFYGLGGFDPTTSWGQPALETTMQQFGGQAGGQQAPPAYVPPPIAGPIRVGGGGGGDSLGNGSSWLNYGEPPQHYVAPPSNERSASQYLMDLENEREAAYLRDNPPPVTVASLGGSPLANPGFQGAAAGPADTQLGMPGPAYVPPNVGNYAARFPNSGVAQNLELANQGHHVLGYYMNPTDAMGTPPAAQQPGGAASWAPIPADELKFRQSLLDQGHINNLLVNPLPDWALQALERSQNPNLAPSQAEIYAREMLAAQALPADYLSQLGATVVAPPPYWNPR